MKMVVGLGNPGDKYKLTRHNVGKTLVLLAGESMDNFESFKGKAWIAKKKIANQDVLLVVLEKSYMNESGNDVQEVAHFYKVSVSDIIIVYDDLDVPLGNIRVSKNTSSGGHNGVQSIIDRLGSTEFSRIRLGIGPQDKPAEAYVLERFTPEQEKLLPAIYTRGLEALTALLSDGLESTAPRFD